MLKPSRRGGMQAVALGLSALGAWLVGRWPLAGLGLFASAGVAMLLARGGKGGIIDDPVPAAEPRRRWEPYFFAALMGLGFLTFAWRLGSIPEGANYSEGMLAVRATGVADAGAYVAHDEGEINWPTLYHYLGARAVKWFGHSPESFRLPSTVFALIALAAFYLAARVLTGPETAAVGSLLWLAFHFNMHFARRYSPIVMLYVPPLLGLASLLLGLRTKRWWWYMAAGFAMGLSLHGYFPGRVMPGSFVLLLAWLWLTRARWGVQRRELALVGAVFLITAWPVVQYAVAKPGEYNQYFAQWSIFGKDKPAEKEGLKPYVMRVVDQVKPYLLMYHHKGNEEYEEDDSYGQPVLDPVAGALFPLGLFLCVYKLGGGVPIFLVSLFVFGMLPGLFTKLGIPPFPRREVAAFPAVFMLIVLALEELRLGLFKAWPAKRWLQVGLLLGAVLLLRQWRHYWVYTHSPGFKRFTNATSYYAGRELRDHAASRALVSESILSSSPSRLILLPPHIRHEAAPRADDFLSLEPGRDNLWLMAPYLEAVAREMTAPFPKADVKVYREKAYDDPAFLASQMKNTIFQAFCPDLTNPWTWLTRVLVPAADVDARMGWLDMQMAGAVVRSADAGFGASHPGRQARLGATVVVDTVGQTLNVRLAWPGWTLRFDGRTRPLNRPFFQQGGLRFVELEGPVPRNAQGPFPAEVAAQPSPGANVPKRPLAWRFEHGFRVAYLRGSLVDWDRPAQYETLLRLPALRFNEDYKLIDYPAQIRVTGYFHPPESGRWELRLAEPGGGNGRLKVGGALAYSRGPEGTQPASPLLLEAGSPVPLRCDYRMELAVAPATGFLLQAKRPGKEAFEWADPAWFRPDLDGSIR